MAIHKLKIFPKWYEDVARCFKNFEIRKADRDFKVGDTLILQEWDGLKYSNRPDLFRTIIYIYYGSGSIGLTENYCILGLQEVPVVDFEGIV